MKEDAKIYIILSLFIIIGIYLGIGEIYSKVHLINLQDNTEKIETIRFQTATVPCKDTENYGYGPNRNRICAHGTTAYCDWDDYQVPANNGTCTLPEPPEED